jgi:hypothetical protein
MAPGLRFNYLCGLLDSGHVAAQSYDSFDRLPYFGGDLPHRAAPAARAADGGNVSDSQGNKRREKHEPRRGEGKVPGQEILLRKAREEQKLRNEEARKKAKAAESSEANDL